MKNVFISYSSADKELANRLTALFEDKGIEVFNDDRSVVAGEKWSALLINTLKEANAVLVILSENSRRSKWVEHELASALRFGRGKTIVPIVVGDKAKESPVWPLIADRCAVEVSQPLDPEDIKRLESLVSNLQKEANTRD